MSINSSDDTLITNVNAITNRFNRYFSIVLILLGIIGNFLNCLASAQRKLRKSPCALFFFHSSIANLVTITSGAFVRLLGTWSLNISNTVDLFCKLRLFILYTSRTTASWLITLGVVDRWLSSSKNAQRRQMSTMENAKRAMYIVLCLISSLHVHILYCYRANLSDSPVECYSTVTWCRLLTDMEFALLNVVFPSLLALIFGLLTIRNIHTFRTVPVTDPITNQENDRRRHRRRLKKGDFHLLLMLLVQVTLTTVFNFPLAVQYLYSDIHPYHNRTPLSLAVNDLIFTLLFLLSYLSNSMPFYIYTLIGGSIFRKALVSAMKNLVRKIICQ
ncbi:unnamed protein product [Adineta ricciae]|uniref:G-protein coupled receptors family 1 profile domain-containing protein n=1 Tax=Adineta ricciae TaxID=249248 RepID=A0A814TEP7_ADIRI|nr:unnamed protein product [Adineta ricciae]CAF1160390.1 unnamed protein product [Adineta ricciae]